MPNIYIIYRSIFNNDGSMCSIGGIETYILNLCCIFNEQGFKCHIVQPAKKNFSVQTEKYTVTGVYPGIYRGNLKKIPLAKWVASNANKENDIVIFATDSYSVKMPGYKTIAIQHGISWDKPQKNKFALIQFLSSLFNQYKYLAYAKSSPNLVCVDHNFVNWYRTWFNAEKQNIKVIYNFYNEIIENEEFELKWLDKAKTINVIIARRFVDYRGIKLIAPVIKQLIPSYNINVSFAGNGPLKAYLKELFSDEPKVTVTQYEPHESFKIHKKQHIAIIPTLGSEGTSLSMIEAMAAGCMVISSNVGGLSNIIINDFNGVLVIPNEGEFINAINKSLSNHQRSKVLALNGLNTISHTCSKLKWAEQWIDTINNIKNQ